MNHDVHQIRLLMDKIRTGNPQLNENFDDPTQKRRNPDWNPEDLRSAAAKPGNAAGVFNRDLPPMAPKDPKANNAGGVSDEVAGAPVDARYEVQARALRNAIERAVPELNLFSDRERLNKVSRGLGGKPQLEYQLNYSLIWVGETHPQEVDRSVSPELRVAFQFVPSKGVVTISAQLDPRRNRELPDVANDLRTLGGQHPISTLPSRLKTLRSAVSAFVSYAASTYGPQSRPAPGGKQSGLVDSAGFNEGSTALTEAYVIRFTKILNS